MSNKMALDALTAAKTQLEILLPDYGRVHEETEALAKIDAAIAALQAEPQPEHERNAARYVWLREHLSTTLLRELTPQASGLYYETCAQHLDDVIDEQIDEEKTKKPIKVFGLITMDKKQQALIQAHCFGDCGKASMAGAIMDDRLGGLMVCCEVVCPWLGKEMADPYGTTMSFGKPHEIYLRALSETPATPPKD